MRSFLWSLYQAAMASLLLLAGPILLLSRGRHYRQTLAGRFARRPAEGWDGEVGALWLHAVSVGEVGVAATLAAALPEDLPLLVTTVTPTGQARARALFKGRATTAYLPFDLAGPVERFFERYRPRALVLVEGDYWPRVLDAARRRSLPTAVINGRVSDRTFPRLARFRGLVRSLMLGRVDRFGMQTAADRDRLTALGVPGQAVVVTGNLKYETPVPELDPALAELVEDLAGERPVLVAGSTMEGEEEQVAEAFRAAGGGAAALLVVAPRHPERFGEAAAVLASGGPGEGLKVVSRSLARGGEEADVLLLDTLGELGALYSLARGAFIGGTLAPTGGHNPLEAARYGVPTVVGPSMENFRQMAEEFDAAGAWSRVAGAAELGEVFRLWLDDPDAAAEIGRQGAALIEANRGALRRTVEMLRPLTEHVEAAGEARDGTGRA